MKTQIIQLTRNDDVISVRDKMSWSQTGRVLLVWPNQGHILNRQLDLNLLKRHAHTMGAQLAFVTQDSAVRFYAGQVGIPVFGSVKQAQDSHWRMGRRRKIELTHNRIHPDPAEWRELIRPDPPAWQKQPAARLVLFGISIFSLFIMGFIILPGAKVSISPREKTQSMAFSVIADPTLSAVNLTTRSLPAYTSEVVVEGRDTITSTGTTTIPDQTAVGALVFTNTSDHRIIIPTGTAVSTAGSKPIEFITTSAGDTNLAPGKSATLSATAFLPGKSGNLPADSLIIVKGVLGPDLQVTNPYRTSGGSNAIVPSPTADDVNQLHEHLTTALKQAALREIQSNVPVGDIPLASSLKIVEVLSDSTDSSVGDPAATLELSLRLRVQSFVVSAQYLEQLVIPSLDANIPTGYKPILNSLSIQQIASSQTGDDSYPRFTILAQRSLSAVIPTTKAIDSIKGKTVHWASENLRSSLPISQEVHIASSPSWWPLLPLLPMRIQLTETYSP